jgi:hypothetical protein
VSDTGVGDLRDEYATDRAFRFDTCDLLTAEPPLGR